MLIVLKIIYVRFKDDSKAQLCPVHNLRFFPDTEKKPKGVTHKIIECVHKLGDVQDPLTGKPVVVDRYRDEVLDNSINLFNNKIQQWNPIP